MWRRAPSILGAISFLSCIVTLVFGIFTLAFTHAFFELFKHGNPAETSYAAQVYDGCLTLRKSTGKKPVPTGGGQIAVIHTLHQWQVLGIRFQRTAIRQHVAFNAPPLPGNYGQDSSLRIPLYWPFFLFGIYPAARFSLLRKQLRRRILRQVNHLCPTCGYDIRATPDACPECGTRVILRTP